MGDVGSHRCSPNACRPRVPCRMTDARFLENELHKGRGQQPPHAGPRRAGAGRPALRHRTWKSDWSPLTTERPVTAKPRGLRATAPGELGKPLSPDGARPGGGHAWAHLHSTRPPRPGSLRPPGRELHPLHTSTRDLGPGRGHGPRSLGPGASPAPGGGRDGPPLPRGPHSFRTCR